MQEFVYEVLGNILTIDLHNGYTVVVIYKIKRETRLCNYTLYLKDNQIDMLDLMEEFENVSITANHKFIKNILRNIIVNLFYNNKFDYYINRYNEQQKCLCYGIDEIGINVSRERSEDIMVSVKESHNSL